VDTTPKKQAAVVPKAHLKLGASLNVTKKDDVTTNIGGISNFDTTNRFRYYQQLTSASPYVSVPLNKLSMMLPKGLTFDAKPALLKDFNRWKQKTVLIEQISTIARLLCRDGTLVGRPNGEIEDFYFYPSLMSQTTILPEGVKPKSKPKEIMQPPNGSVYVNEGLSGQTEHPLEELIIGRFNSWDYVQEDVKKRETYGLYGASLLDPLELSIRNLLNINKGYVTFVKRYGMGRYHYDHVMLEKLTEAGVIQPDDAAKYHDDWLEDNKNLSENEDISAVGLKINPIDAKGSLDVMNFKESLETEIQLGLFQSPLTMGKASGTTYASGYLVEEDRLVVLETLQTIVKNLAQEYINRRLLKMGKQEDSVIVNFDELSRIKLTASEVQEMYNTGVIERDEFRSWAGFYQVVGEEDTNV
jgi:hypothetical protein